MEKEGLPVAFITSMVSLAEQVGAKRIVKGIKVPHPCGDPEFPEGEDLDLRRKIVKCALEAVQKNIDRPTVFEPNPLKN